MKLLSKDEAAKESVKTEPIDQILQVRELLFGEALRKVEARLDSLKKENDDLRKLLKDTEDKLAQATNALRDTVKSEREADGKKLADQLTDLDRTLSQKIKSLDENKVDRSQIGQAFMEWGNKIRQIVNP